MFKFIRNKLTKNSTEIPLFWTTFNLKLFKEKGKEGSCITRIHPKLADDKHIENALKNLIDYIRDNYDMEDIV